MNTLTLPTSAPPKSREYFIDLFKGLLVLLMIFDHVFKALGGGALGLGDPAVKSLVRLIDLWSFPGFLFAFGYVAEIAYFRHPFIKAWPRMIRAALRCLLAFYGSELAFILAHQLPPEKTWREIEAILLFRKILPFSEFLLSFAAISVLAVGLFPFLKSFNGWKLAATICLSFAAIWLAKLLPTPQPNLVGVLLGSTVFPSFPVVQNLFFFAAGIFWAKKKITRVSVVFASAIPSLIFLYHAEILKTIPQRFPPDWIWLMGAVGFVLGGIKLCQAVEHIFPVLARRAGFIGKHSLLFLLVSNIAIFVLTRIWREPMPIGIIILLTVLVCIFAACLGAAVDQIHARRPRA